MTASFGNLILDKKVFAFNRDILKFGFQNLVKLSWKIYKLCSILIRQFFLQLNFPSIEFRIFPCSNIFIFAKCHIFSRDKLLDVAIKNKTIAVQKATS